MAKQFNKISCYFEKPINSLKLGIALVEDTIIDIELTEFSKYMILFDNHNNNVAYPILHTFDVI